MFRELKAGVVVVLIMGFASGCTKGGVQSDSPQKTLSDYVSMTFGMKSPSEVSKLKEMTTDSAKGELEKLEQDPELFKKNFVDEKNEFVSLKIRDERKLADDRISITYELTYVNHSPEAKVEDTEGHEQVKASANDKITTKKHALFVRQDGKWLISEVKNLKTFVDHEGEEKISAEKR